MPPLTIGKIVPVPVPKSSFATKSWLIGDNAGCGSKIKYPVQEKEIIDFIFKCKEIGIPLNTNIIIEELYRICPKIKNNSKKSLRKWCYRLFKKYQLKIKDIATV